MRATIKRILAKLVPLSPIQAVLAEVRIAVNHARSALIKSHYSPDLLVNIGCGCQPLQGWINIDLINAPGILYWDCRRSLPFETNSVKFIFAEHVFEHLENPSETSRFLSECLRTLQPNGILRLVVPDAGRYIRMYAQDDWKPLAETRPLTQEKLGYKDRWIDLTYRTRMEMMNAIFRQGGEHKYAYDAETLILHIEQAGFKRVIQQSYAKSLFGTPPDRADRGPESLYVEAVKSS